MPPLSPTALPGITSPTKIHKLPVIGPLAVAASSGDGLSGGAIAGVVLGVLGVCFSVWRLYVWNKKRNSDRAMIKAAAPPQPEKALPAAPGIEYPLNSAPPPIHSPASPPRENWAAGHPYGAPRAGGSVLSQVYDGGQSAPGFGAAGQGHNAFQNSSDPRMYTGGNEVAPAPRPRCLKLPAASSSALPFSLSPICGDTGYMAPPLSTAAPPSASSPTGIHIFTVVSPDGGLSHRAIVGIVLAALVALVPVYLVIRHLRRRKSRSASNAGDSAAPIDGPTDEKAPTDPTAPPHEGASWVEYPPSSPRPARSPSTIKSDVLSSDALKGLPPPGPGPAGDVTTGNELEGPSRTEPRPSAAQIFADEQSYGWTAAAEETTRPSI
ncbi:hypothetical protein B0H17DRAFT_1211933 [Mycena rosella]|uniref:Uncharacterized protein n=1 Tax=Mycena rosella TaxID=1033263 RepID=A0AAD7G3J2_MYCRO|nr:hypothetical protein B0H17DRAFT_1211933 [Mycena rosella]